MIRLPMTSSRFYKCAVVLLGTALLAEAPAFAKRSIEDAVLKSARPHETAGGAKVRVHYVSRHIMDQAGPGVSLKALQQSVQRCVASQIKGGKKANPPTTWPEEAAYEGRVDSYYARNRGITYIRGVQFTVNPTDCSLIELEVSEATLRSSYGACQIDLVNKTYVGQCDMKAHEHASFTPMTPIPPANEKAAYLAKIKANPQTAAMAAAMEAALGNVPQPTGAIKAFDGAKCEVMTVSGPTKGTQCVLRGGSFVPSLQAIDSGMPGVLLEYNVSNVSVQVADRVKLDTEVGASVFTPNLQGFTKQDGGDQ